MSTPKLIKRSWRSVVTSILAAALAGSAVLPLLSVFEVYGADVDLHFLGLDATITLPIAPLIFAVLLARPLFLMRDQRHELRTGELRSISGLFSIRKTQVDVPYAEMLGVRYTQSLLERLLNVGTISVWTAVAEAPEIEMRGIGNPQHYTELIEQLIETKRQRYLPAP